MSFPGEWIASQDRVTRRLVKRLDDVLVDLPQSEAGCVTGPTAILCVMSFSGFGLHLVAAVCELFPRYFSNFIFVSASPPESRLFERIKDFGRLGDNTEQELKKYVAWARAHKLRADYRAGKGGEAIRQLVGEYPDGVVFIGKPIFREREYPRSFYNRIATTLERRLLCEDIQTIVLPIGVPDS